MIYLIYIEYTVCICMQYGHGTLYSQNFHLQGTVHKAAQQVLMLVSQEFFCASINVCQRIWHVSPEAWQAVIEINLRRIIFKVFVLQRNFRHVSMRFVEDNGHDQPISDSFFAKPRPVMWNRKLRPWGLWSCKCMTWKLVRYWTLHSLHVTTY